MEAIHNYVEALFAVLPQRKDVLRVKDDMLANLEEKFRALLETGRNEEEATGIVIASIGSGEELREQFGTQVPAAASRCAARSFSSAYRSPPPACCICSSALGTACAGRSRSPIFPSAA